MTAPQRTPFSNSANVVDEAEARPPFPPFIRETAIQKVRGAEDGWNSRDPARVSLAYSLDSVWRNRARIRSRTAGDRRIPGAQVDEGTRLPADQGALGIH